MTIGITFTDEKMTTSAAICADSMLANNIHEARILGMKDIEPTFYKKHKSIFEADRGPGFWLWKPTLIHQTLKTLNEGDYLVYCDAGVEVVNNINYLIERVDQDVYLFGSMYTHAHWCKADIVKEIMPEWYDTNFITPGPVSERYKQAQASVIIVKNTEKGRFFVHEWLKYCLKPGLIDDSPSKAVNHPEFRENRHDQAILATLAYRDSIKLHWWPAKYNDGAFTYPKTGYIDEPIPIIFHHHRRRNKGVNDGQPTW